MELQFIAGGATGPWKKGKRRKKDTDGQSVASESVLSENMYSDLDDDDCGDAIPDQQQRKLPKAAPTPEVPKKVKLPPLVVVNCRFHVLQPLVEKTGVKPGFKICGIGIKILCQTEAEFQTIESLLKQCKLEYFSHDKPGEKPFKAIVRGLPGVTTESLKSQLLAEHRLKTIEVHQITRQETTKFRDNMYLIHFPRGSTTMKQLREIRSISNILVTWVPYRSKRDVTMCMNCLNFGHGTRHCHRLTRCNRCAADHPTDKCTAAEEADPRCANCGGKHLATDKTCGKREEFRKIRQHATVGKQPGRKRTSLPPENNEVNFPPMQPNPTNRSARSNSGGPPPGFQRSSSQPSGSTRHSSDPPPRSAWNSGEAPSSLYTPAELMKIFAEMSSSLRGCTSKFEQIQVLGSFVIQYGY